MNVGYLKKTQSLTKQQGFTLLELLVVIVIIGIVTTFVSLSLRGNQTDVLEQEAQRLHALLDLTAHESISKTTEMGVYFADDHYQFYHLNEGQWQLLVGDEILSVHTLPESLTLQVDIEGISMPNNPNTTDLSNENPQVLFFTDGELTPFRCILSLKRDLQKYYIIQGMLNGQLNLQQGDSI